MGTGVARVGRSQRGIMAFICCNVWFISGLGWGLGVGNFEGDRRPYEALLR